MILDALYHHVRRLLRPGPPPDPKPTRAAPDWHDLVWTLAAWTPPAGVEFVVAVKPATGVVNVVLRAEHFVGTMPVASPEPVTLFYALRVAAEEVLRVSDRRGRELGEAAGGWARREALLVAASSAFHRGIGVAP